MRTLLRSSLVALALGSLTLFSAAQQTGQPGSGPTDPGGPNGGAGGSGAGGGYGGPGDTLPNVPGTTGGGETSPGLILPPSQPGAGAQPTPVEAK